MPYILLQIDQQKTRAVPVDSIFLVLLHILFKVFPRCHGFKPRSFHIHTLYIHGTIIQTKCPSFKADVHTFFEILGTTSKF